jgi:hypothetical protein
MPDYSLGAIEPQERIILRGEASAWVRGLSTPQLVIEIESNRWSLGEIDDCPEAIEWTATSREWTVWRLRALNEELSTRRRIAAANAEGSPAFSRDPIEMKNELEEIKRRVDLCNYVEIFGRVRLEKRGKELWSCCPLPGHEEETPSFHVDPEKQLFHCFGCNRGGDLFEFARQIHQEAHFYVLLPALRALAGMPVPSAPKQTKSQSKRRVVIV